MHTFIATALLGLVAVSAALPAEDLFETEWAQYKSTHGKEYSGEAEEFLRKAVYRSNKEAVAKHNEEFAQGKHTFTMALNHFADMPLEEFSRVMNRYQQASQESTANAQFVELDSAMALPASVDWRSKGIVTPVKNQGQCGGCWAFSSTGALEGAHAKATGNLVSLSEQQLVDCAGGQWGDYGCNGGLMDNAFKYIKAVGGLEKESDYPYYAQTMQCKFNKTLAVVTDTGYVDIKRGSESGLQQALATVGPVSVAIDASHMSFQMYHSGVYYEASCSSESLDHGVLAVGYGSEDGQDYWLVKNSWATVWGEEGYIKMSRNRDNNCGIATSASYPTV